MSETLFKCIEPSLRVLRGMTTFLARQSQQGYRLALLLSLSVVLPWNIAAQGVPLSIENQVRVAFVHNFLKYVTIPQVGQKLTLCVFAPPDLAEQFHNLSAREVGGRSISVRTPSSLSKLESCHAAFYAGQSRAAVQHSLKTIGERSILTIGETASFTEDGGIIRMFRQGTKVRFEINPKAAKERSLSISSRLLKLAKIFDE
jgi:hypothetical protein